MICDFAIMDRNTKPSSKGWNRAHLPHNPSPMAADKRALVPLINSNCLTMQGPSIQNVPLIRLLFVFAAPHTVGSPSNPKRHIGQPMAAWRTRPEFRPNKLMQINR